ncbi:MAG: hypothetical protein KGL46_11675 [Hyphomicrobiales bacterium]|nr:hypothetical protein [Hyphomicrobiales bacterium]
MSRMRLFSAAIGLFCAACASERLVQPPEDGGGNLRAYLAEVDRLNAQGASKRIEGACVSACTAYLGVRKVCLARTAELWFHAAHLPGGGPDAAGSLELLARYPEPVRQWAIQTKALESVSFEDDHRLVATQLAQMGVPLCNP